MPIIFPGPVCAAAFPVSAAPDRPAIPLFKKSLRFSTRAYLDTDTIIGRIGATTRVRGHVTLSYALIVEARMDRVERAIQALTVMQADAEVRRQRSDQQMEQLRRVFLWAV